MSRNVVSLWTKHQLAMRLAIEEWFSSWVGQVVRFGLVGVANTFVDTGLYFLLSRSNWLPNLVWAKAFSYSVGVLNSYYWNKSWTFQSRVKSGQVFPLFVAVNLLAVGLNTWMMHLALDVLGMSEVSALTLATGATFVWNFIVNKFFIFR
ncbi:MAG: GtrA family protein [Anaerolineales bacterium]|nr:GtrA family protein [Anaerolineales bacterium]